MKNEKIKVILDTDVASVDDSFALCYALASSDKLDVLAVTLAPFKSRVRDVSIEENQLDGKFEVARILSLMGKSSNEMVFAGANEYLSGDEIQTNAAVEKIKEIAEKEEICVLCTGALTNIATLLKLYPKLKSKLRLIWVGTGNLLLDKFDDHNYVSDKLAFEQVIKSGVDISVIPVYVARQFVTDTYELEHNITKSAIGKYLAHLVKESDTTKQAIGNKTLYDIAVVAYLLAPEKFTEKQINANELLKEQRKLKKEVLIRYVFDLKSGFSVWNDVIKKISAVEHTTKTADIFFVSDTHFTQKSKISRNQVPFKTMEECDREIIIRWNKVVSKNDIVYHLGDFGNYEKIKELNGKVTLICGNYEKEEFGENFEDFRKKLIAKGFVDVIRDGLYLDESVLGEKIYLTHEPINHAKDCRTIFGHVHNLAPVKPFGFNVCVTYHDFTPVSSSRVKRLLEFVKGYSKDRNVFCE
ncbi:MAG: nucleoside hydrolase [Clostridia bacterium]|nr:nucleoside hydrolase [Clostridia bacterium]